MPPALAKAATESIKYLKKSNYERILQKQKTTTLKKYLSKENINYLDHNSHIVPVMVNNPIRCSEISNILLNDLGRYV